MRHTCAKMKRTNYDKLGEDVLAEPGVRVSNSDVLIGKTVPHAITGADGRVASIARRDESIEMRSNEQGIVDKVMLTTNEVIIIVRR